MSRTRITRNHPRPDSGGTEYDNSGSGLSAENVQDAIDELAAMAGGIDIGDGTTTVSPATQLVFDPDFFDVIDGDYGIAEVTLIGDTSTPGYPKPMTTYDPDLDIWVIVVDGDGNAVMIEA